MLRGVADDAERYQALSRLAARTRGVGRIGRACPGAVVARTRADEAGLAARIGALWEDVDVLLTPTLAKPPLRVGELDGRGALWSLLADAAFIPYTPPGTGPGRPAVSLRGGFPPEGLPLGAQLVGRANDE